MLFVTSLIDFSSEKKIRNQVRGKKKKKKSGEKKKIRKKKSGAGKKRKKINQICQMHMAFYGTMCTSPLGVSELEASTGAGYLFTSGGLLPSLHFLFYPKPNNISMYTPYIPYRPVPKCLLRTLQHHSPSQEHSRISSFLASSLLSWLSFACFVTGDVSFHGL